MTEAEKEKCFKMVADIKKRSLLRLSRIKHLSIEELQKQNVESDKDMKALQKLRKALDNNKKSATAK